jgi:hypothetical protein
MTTPLSGIRPNDCLVTDNVVSSARNLIQGRRLTPLNFADLCSIIEMVILHERIIMTLPTLVDSPLESLVETGIISSTMFKDATPVSNHDKVYVQRIYERCLRTVQDGATFGRGIINVPESDEEETSQALTRIQIGEMMLRVQHGAEVEPAAQESLSKLNYLYGIFTEYADSVFDAARHFKVHAYASSSEVPFSIQNTIKSTPRLLYEKLGDLYRDRVDKFLIEAGFRSYNIPPFALIVLSRCKSRDDIVPQMLRARDEFSKFRYTCTKYSKDLVDASKDGTIEDIVKLHNSLDRATEVLTRKIKATDSDSRIVYRIWNIVKAMSPLEVSVNLIDQLKSYGMDREDLKSVNGLLDVWVKLKKGSSYEAILRSSLFPNEFDEELFDTFDQFLSHVRRYMPVSTGQA